ncbi:hypothetical protein CC1G_00153 [Coprinopsis cinerea okayama7|uniref:Uncharacterized protein n=1 Tax=Coprinopsis cinerea (strain Okayama-7 / 130 / ATCC MYA-4618 / FGSC 9003) TaxID=240176 RepID=A8NWY4_COPC7|nr:hypothetical protein CC1G_00153 [Coprinopsis cinerea okayama7\|eukprot:XP_001837017.2 hypothetical protein CC1G_00153 [Coprinopsis cinerea okayama7\
MVPEPDEDSINVQDLQAQIDLSMSFAQSLASSWIKPQKTPGKSSTRSKDLESEILESTKRPSRLGVGASASQATQHTSREAARLKGQLIGKKRGREGDEPVEGAKKPVVEEDDREEESRSGAIKKKVKFDPFDVSSKKKKKKSLLVMSTPTSTTSGPSSSTPAPGKEEKSSSLSTASKAVGLLEKTKPPPDFATPFKPSWDAEAISPDKEAKKSDTSSTQHNKSTVLENAKDTGRSASPVQPKSGPSSPKAERSKSAYLSLVAPLSPDKTKLPPELLKKPVLNLSDHSDSDNRNVPENSSSNGQKKKRRRKKKKKNVAEDGNANGTSTALSINGTTS